MRMTVIPVDNTVIIDGDPRVLEDGVFYPEGVSAFQWYGDVGAVEYIDKSLENKRVFDKDDTGLPPEPWASYVNLHAQAKARDEDKAQKEQERRDKHREEEEAAARKELLKDM